MRILDNPAVGATITTLAALTTSLDTLAAFPVIKAYAATFAVSVLAGVILGAISSRFIQDSLGDDAYVGDVSNGKSQTFSCVNLGTGLLPSFLIAISQKAAEFFAKPVIAGIRLGFVFSQTCCHLRIIAHANFSLAPDSY